MQVRRVGGDGHLIVLERGEKVMASLVEYATANGLSGGWISGLGSLRRATLGYYDLEHKSYIRRTFEDDMELSGLTGNLAVDGEERIFHLHCCLGGTDFATWSGHLFEAEVAVIAEFLLQDFGVPLVREQDDAIGLRTLCPQRDGNRGP